MFDLTIILLVTFISISIAVFIRFGLKYNSKDFYMKIMKRYKRKRMFHFHHFFWGLIIMIIFYLYYHPILFNAGLGIALSDITYHFIILKTIKGKSEFNVFYSKKKLKNQLS